MKFSEAVLTSTHDLCFRAKNKKEKSIPLKNPVLLYKSGCKKDVIYTGVLS